MLNIILLIFLIILGLVIITVLILLQNVDKVWNILDRIEERRKNKHGKRKL